MNTREYDALDDLAALYMLQKKSDKAIARINQQLQTDKSSVVYKLLGKAYAESGKFPEAEQAFKQALTLQPQDYTTHMQLGQLYMTQKTLDKAIVEFDTATKANPKNAGLWTLFGILNQEARSEEHTSELQSRFDLVCRLLLEK